jgi:CBS domain-containing protein
MAVSRTAKDVMDPNVVAIDASASILDSIKLMASTNSWSIVVEREKLPVGVITDRDVLRRCLAVDKSPERMKAEEIMSSPIITVDPAEHLGKVMETMVEKDIRRVFVVEDGKIIGKITQTKMFDDSLEVMATLSTLQYQM